MELVEKRSFWSFLKQPWWIAGWMLVVGLSWQSYEAAWSQMGASVGTIVAALFVIALQYFTWPFWLGMYLFHHL